MAKVITVSSGKGGVGKSTAATNLAIDLALRGKRVALIDGENNGTTLDYQDYVPENVDVYPGYTLHIDKQVAAYRACYDYIVCDTAGNDPETTLGNVSENLQSVVNTKLIVSADLVIVPVVPAPISVSKTLRFLSVLDHFICASRGQIKAFTLLNCFKRTERISKEAVKALSDISVPLAEVKIRNSTEMTHAEGQYQSINQYAKGSLVAEDYRRLLSYVLEVLEG